MDSSPGDSIGTEQAAPPQPVFRREHLQDFLRTFFGHADPAPVGSLSVRAITVLGTRLRRLMASRGTQFVGAQPEPSPGEDFQPRARQLTPPAELEAFWQAPAQARAHFFRSR
jgi:hypothetical protein